VFAIKTVTGSPNLIGLQTSIVSLTAKAIQIETGIEIASSLMSDSKIGSGLKKTTGTSTGSASAIAMRFHSEKEMQYVNCSAIDLKSESATETSFLSWLQIVTETAIVMV
jgi:hypothetical protein